MLGEDNQVAHQEEDMKVVPSALDLRAAEAFHIFARMDGFRVVDCRFRRLDRRPERYEHKDYVRDEAFVQYFGNPPDYFAGAIEYVRLATGWHYPLKVLEVVVVTNGKHKVSSGAVLPMGKKRQEMIVSWHGSEFTLTVLHEVVHLFKPIFWSDDYYEKWVEEQALKLTLGI